MLCSGVSTHAQVADSPDADWRRGARRMLAAQSPDTPALGRLRARSAAVAGKRRHALARFLAGRGQPEPAEGPSPESPSEHFGKLPSEATGARKSMEKYSDVLVKVII